MALLTPRVRRIILLTIPLSTAFTIVSVGSIRHPAAQSSRAADSQTLPGAAASTEQGLSQEPRDRGATYEWLESQATRVTVRFADIVATSERTAGADIKTRLTDLVGNDVGTFKVHRVDAMNDELEFRSTDAMQIRPARRTGARPTLDWASRQAYSLWKDQATGASRLEWQEGLLRPRGARLRDLDRDVSELHTEWANGLSATASRAPSRRHVTGAHGRGNSFISRLKQDSVEVGSSRWYVDERVLAWSFPGLTEGYLDADRLKPIGGWPFTPDLAWANVQSFAFHYFHTLMAKQGFVARRQKNGWTEKVLELVMPTILANDPGCDGFHWLDRTVFRPCCDVHDRCYRRNGCGASSWWLWWSSWQCNSCNQYAFFCFATGGRVPYRQTPY